MVRQGIFKEVGELLQTGEHMLQLKKCSDCPDLEKCYQKAVRTQGCQNSVLFTGARNP